MSPWSGFRDPTCESDPSLVGDFSMEEDPQTPDLKESDIIIDIPQQIQDPYYFGLEVETEERCFHGEVPERMVAFDMAATGRKFLGCARKVGRRCSFVSWVDDPWNPVLTRAILHLWNLASYRPMNRLRSSRSEFNNNKRLYEPTLPRIDSDFTDKDLLQELKLKIGIMEKNMITCLRSQNNVCVAAVSVAVTLAFVLLVETIKYNG